jgi:LacI family transcriptional regulator
VVSTQPSGENVRRIEESQVPYVVLDQKIPGLSASFVGNDDVMAGSLATGHLVEVGCKTIAYLGGSAVSTAVDRQAGYVATLARHGPSLPPEYVVAHKSTDDSGEDSGYKGMKHLLALRPMPDGVFCYDDTIAVGAMRAIFDAGLRIPQDVAIVGCGNFDYDDLLRIPLTSIDQDSEGLEFNAAKLAIGLTKRKPNVSPKKLLMPVKLVVRASSSR